MNLDGLTPAQQARWKHQTVGTLDVVYTDGPEDSGFDGAGRQIAQLCRVAQDSWTLRAIAPRVPRQLERPVVSAVLHGTIVEAVHEAEVTLRDLGWNLESTPL